MNVKMIIILVALTAVTMADDTCQTSTDIAMLFDSSLSVGTHGFAAFKKYAVDMIGNMDVGPEKARVCVVVFTFIKKVVFDLKTYNSTKELQNAISRIRFEKVATAIVKGMTAAAHELYNDEGGARLGVPKFLIIFSDGDFMEFYPYPELENINILAIGTGSLSSYSEGALKELVKDPNKDFFTTEVQAQEVVNRIDHLAKQSCKNKTLASGV